MCMQTAYLRREHSEWRFIYMTKNELKIFLKRSPSGNILSRGKRPPFSSRRVRFIIPAASPSFPRRATASGCFLSYRGRCVSICQAEDGRQITIYRLHTGEPCVLSASCALSAITFDVLIDTGTDCDLLLIPSIFFSKLMRENIYLEAFAYRMPTSIFSVMGAMERIFFINSRASVSPPF